MNPHQWEIWECRPPGFERDHWFVVVSSQERCDEPRQLLVNGLACFTLRGQPRKSEVRLNFPCRRCHAGLALCAFEEIDYLLLPLGQVHVRANTRQ